MAIRTKEKSKQTGQTRFQSGSVPSSSLRKRATLESDPPRKAALDGERAKAHSLRPRSKQPGFFLSFRPTASQVAKRKLARQQLSKKFGPDNRTMSDEIQVPTGTVDAGTNTNPLAQADLLGKIESITDKVIEQHNRESGKRGVGKRGPDKSPRRKSVPVEKVGNGSASPLVDANSTIPDSPAWSESPSPLVDDATAKAVSDLVIAIAKDARSTLNGLAALLITGSDEIKVPEVSPELDGALRKIGPAAVKENSEILNLSPTTIVCCIAGYVAVTDSARLLYMWRESRRLKSANTAQSQ